MNIKVHNLVSGKHLTYKNSYRKDQNVVADSVTGSIVCMPPEAKDVGSLIKQTIKKFNSKDSSDIPIPIKAGFLLMNLLQYILFGMEPIVVQDYLLHIF